MLELLEQRNGSNQSGNATVSFSCSNGSVSRAGNGFWSKHPDDISYNQLQKFWSELSPQERQELLRIEKQMLFEQARKNMYCSRCNGLLLEGFLQIVMYGKSLQQEVAGGHHACNGFGALKKHRESDSCTTTGCQDDVQDPSVHPWGGLTTTRDGILTLMDCYLYSESLKGLQNVFDSARARERERELLYPDACGGGGRGWISQGMAGYGRGHGTRETCALHTARLSVDTLVDFWSALGEETRQSLLRMKEEDFIERLMYRFDSKRFCRDCRRNVIREFKELKELKRLRKEPRCTNWFCVADTAFQYEVSHDTVQADWHDTFIDTFGSYHHFEWAIGTGEGKSDILEYENVGLSGRIQVTGLDLNGLNACYITLRAWKKDGHCTELSVKAHALKGQQCVHCRLVVGDGFITITRGESIRRFFEHAEEAEEEEDDDSMDKDGNELDGECSRPQKHAKSPELAREFLLDAATVIFKEQVEKAFREGTARQNAHSIFVCLALKLLEERVHVACKEIITLEKQMKLLEEEEKEKREEEERKERKRNKEREKKLRRKERLKEKEKDKDKKGCEVNQRSMVSDVSKEDITPGIDEDSNVVSRDSVNELGEAIPSSPDIEDDQLLDVFVDSNMQDHSDDIPGMDFSDMKDGDNLVPINNLKFSHQKLKFRKEFHQDPNLKWPDRRRFAFVSESGSKISKHETRHPADNFETSRNINGLNKQLRSNGANSNMRNGGPKFCEKFYCSNIRTSDRFYSHPCSCNQQNEYRAKLVPYMTKVVPERKSESTAESKADMSIPYCRRNNCNQVEYIRENSGRPKSKNITSNNSFSRDTTNARKVWEPMESQKKYPRSNSDSDVTLRSSTFKVDVNEFDQHRHSSDVSRSEKVIGNVEFNHEAKVAQEVRVSSPGTDGNRQNGFHLSAKTHQCTKEVADEESELSSSTTRSLHGTSDSSFSSSSNFDNCSSCLSEGDSNASSSNPQNTESSSISDSEDSSQNSEVRENSPLLQNGFSSCHETVEEKRQSADKEEQFGDHLPDSSGSNNLGNVLTKTAPNLDNGRVNVGGTQPQIVLPPLHNQNLHFPMFQAPAVGYYHQTPVTWPAAPANGLMPFPHANHYVLPSPLGYDLNGNTLFMQYGGLQHLTPPLLNNGHLPVFQPVPQTNGINLREHAKIPNQGLLKEPHHEANLQKVVPSVEHPREAPKTMETSPNGKSNNSGVENTGFSLFHFGVPAALSTGLMSDPVSLKEGIADEICSNLSADLTEVDHACNKKNCIEEYNLFAASNGIKFSFF